MIYEWRGFSAPAVVPQVIGEEIERCRQDNGGMLTRGDFVEAQRARDALCHTLFEWNDQVAGEEHRKTQAGYYIRHVVAVQEVKSDAEPVRAFVSVHVAADSGGRRAIYTAMAVAMASPEMRDDLLRSALQDLQAFQRKYQSLVDLSDIFVAIMRVQEKAARRRKSLVRAEIPAI